MPADMTHNPLYSTSTAEASRSRSSGVGGSSGYRGESGSGAYSSENTRAGRTASTASSWRSGTTGSGTLEPMSSSSFDTDHGDDRGHDGGGSAYSYESSERGYGGHGGGGGGGGGSTLSVNSEASSAARRPFGLSPVAERAGGRGESSAEITTDSSTPQSASTVYHARAGAGGPRSGNPGSFGYPDSSQAFSSGGGGGGGGAVTDDDDAESMFRPPSPGSVTRPLQPLLAQHSPLSAASGFGSRSNSFAMSSRSNSFASPVPGAGAGGTTWVAGVGLQKGIPAESLKVMSFFFFFFYEKTRRLFLVGGDHWSVGSIRWG